MMTRQKVYRYGANLVESRQAEIVPGPMPRRGPPNTTGGNLPLCCGVKAQGNRVKSIDQTPRTLNLLQWNAEGVLNKKMSLTKRLYEEKIDVACIQETHLNAHHRFSVRGFQAIRYDREGHKGGVLILVRNSIPSSELSVTCNNQTEIVGVDIMIKEETIRIYNLYSPANKDLALSRMEIKDTNCIVVGDFNSRSERWGYPDTDNRGDEVEDWEIDYNLHLINKPEDKPSFYSRRWCNTSTPDLAFCTGDILHKTDRAVLDQLAGSDHRPVKLTVNMTYTPEEQTPLPRWNYKRADWDKFAILTDRYCGNIKTRHGEMKTIVERLNKAILQAAHECIPRGARKNYRPYWTKELQILEDKVEDARKTAEEEQTTEANVLLKAISAKYRRTLNQTTRDSWHEKTENLNLDRDGNKLWKLVKVMNNEGPSSRQITIKQGNNVLTGKKAANALMEHYASANHIDVTAEQKKAMKDEQAGFNNTEISEVMMANLNLEELEQAMSSLKKKKSPGNDGITNEMLIGLGTKAKRKLLAVLNCSWKRGIVPQAWKEAILIPVQKKGKDPVEPNAYRPISLLSCVGKLMERMINNRLMGHLEEKHILTPQQAGFRKHRSTEDQITYIAQEIEDAFQEKKHTLAVWVDLEKAFDKVWKEGLKVKLQKMQVCGKMYTWISHYLENRTARTKVQGQLSNKMVLEQGVPQGGVLSPTLFLAYINDISNSFPARVHTSSFADDLAIWTCEEHISVANNRIQQALSVLEEWSKTWLVNISEEKTTCTVFSLSNKKQPAKLVLNGKLLRREENPKYLGVTFDCRLTWRTQIEASRSRARQRMAIMKKLAGTTWGADEKVLKKLYTARVRPVLEYGITAWATAAKSNFVKISRVQNQGMRIITGSMKTTPINELEKITGLQPMEDRRDSRVQQQAEKFRRMTDHPMYKRFNGLGSGRLKRNNFVKTAKTKIRADPILSTSAPKPIHSTYRFPAWRQQHLPELIENIPGIEKKNTQCEIERMTATINYIEKQYPSDTWTHAYTDGSAKNSTENGGGGILLKLKHGTKKTQSVATGKYSSNFRAEAEALRTAADMLLSEKDKEKYIAIFTDAKSVVSVLKSKSNTELVDLKAALYSLSQKSERVVIQWIPSHCNIPGNEEADKLAKKGGRLHQPDIDITYNEAKRFIKSTYRTKWESEHPGCEKDDTYHQLNRREQVAIFRLRTGHNRLKYHLFNKLKIGETDDCSCGAGKMMAKHLLQDCLTYTEQRRLFWPTPATFEEKLYGNVINLKLTAAFIKNIQIDI